MHTEGEYKNLLHRAFTTDEDVISLSSIEHQIERMHQFPDFGGCDQNPKICRRFAPGNTPKKISGASRREILLDPGKYPWIQEKNPGIQENAPERIPGASRRKTPLEKIYTKCHD